MTAPKKSLETESSKPTEVKIFGQKLLLRSSSVSDPEVMNQIVELATRKIAEAENRSRAAVPHQIALLALLDLAEEYVLAKKRTADFKQQLDEKSNRLLDLVEAEFRNET